MYEIADRLIRARDAGGRVAVATAVSIEGSAPRTVGTSMAFDGVSVMGSIAGGCVEGAVVEACESVLADGIPRTVDYGIDDETAMSVGLTCGGQLRVQVQLFEGELEWSLREGLPLEVCHEFTEQPPQTARMIIFGAMEFSAALSSAAQAVGYRVTVCDPRSLFATAERFPGAELVVTWPTDYLATTDVDENTVICVLSHDARFDAELIAQALSLPVAYVGAMGSRNTHDRRVASLADRGVHDVSRLHSPIGLDIGGSTPAETAISILAEVIAERTGASRRQLTVTTGAIHTRVTASAPFAPRGFAPSVGPELRDRA